MTRLATMAGQGSVVLNAAMPVQTIPYGPWRGSMRSRPADQVPRDFLSGGSNFLYLPRSGYWRRRGGTVEKFDTFGAEVGLLPAKWGAKARWMDEFLSDVVSDGVPTLMTLATKETVVLGLDDGRFSQVWIRDQVNDLNYTLGDEFGDTTYPEPGAVQSYRIVPLWYDSGDGGITRGVSEFSRRLFFGGSRRFLKVGNWWYFPSVLGTPSRWNGGKAAAVIVQPVSLPASDGAAVEWTEVGAATATDCIDDPVALPPDADTTYLSDGTGTSLRSIHVMEPITAPITGTWKLKFTLRRTAGTYPVGPFFGLTSQAGATPSNDIVNFQLSTGRIGTIYSTYEHILTAGQMALLETNKAAFKLQLISPASAHTGETRVTQVFLEGPVSEGRNVSFPETDAQYLTQTGWAEVPGLPAFDLLNDPVGSPDDDTTYITDNSTPSLTTEHGMQSISVPITGVWKITVRIRRTNAGDNAIVPVALLGQAGLTTIVDHQILAASFGTTWSTYEYTLSAPQMALLETHKAAFFLRIASPSGTTGDVQISQVYVSGPAGSGTPPPGTGTGSESSAAFVNRLIPSGPLPPTHAGTLEKGAAIAVDAETRIFPDADLTDGTWTTVGGPTDLYDCINSLSSEADYISTNASGGTFCEISIANPAFTPASGEAVVFTIRLRVFADLAGGNGTVTAELRDGATVKFSAGSITPTLAWIYYSFTLSAAQVASIANWVTADLRLRLTPAGSIGTIQCAEQYITITPSGVASAGGWLGSDRFFYSVAYRFEDDSVWAPCEPRFPNDLLPNGLNLFTVDSANPTTRYDRVRWTGIPIGPHGTKGRILLRCPKIDSTTSDNLQLKPRDLRVVVEIPDNTTTTYDDYFANDDAIYHDVVGAFIRFDHSMPPRARHIFGGDLRVCHSYGGQNPCAIVLAPVGRTADYDLNDYDGAASLYNEDASYFLVTLGDGGQFLNLTQTNGTTVTDTMQLDFSVYDTLQKLVDRINATSVAANGQQWRAQLCPGVNPETSTVDALTPNVRVVSACETTSGVAEIRRTAGGLGRVSVGATISVASAQFPAGTYITRIDSDTKLITSANAIATSSATNYFYFELGDSPTAATADIGYQRAIANSLPGFLYFSKDYLDNEPLDKQAVWMTVASPGQVKSAANNFSGRTANKHTPPLTAGISMGGAAVDQGFVVGFAYQMGAIRNMRDSGSGLDEEYRLQMFNESRGAIGPIVPGNRVAFYPTPEGISAADLFRELQLSEHIYVHAPDPLGDFFYEAPLSLAAAAIDNDTGYFHLRVMRSALYVSFRNLGSHPDRIVVYDFSTGESAGLEALVRGPTDRWPGQLWGWSLPLNRLGGTNGFLEVPGVTAMAEIRRADGSHLYGWNDLNEGSVGDGRVDEIEFGDMDNVTEIAAEGQVPWVPSSEETDDLISGQEMIVEHSSPEGSTGTLEFHRSLSDVVSVLQLGTSAEVVRSELKQLPQTARAATQRCYLGYKQATGPARELRSMKFKAKLVPRYRPT